MGKIRACALALAAWTLIAPALAAGNDIEKLAWLAGCWQGQLGEAKVTEVWLPLAGGTMLGVSRTVRQGKTVDFEFMQLRHQSDGTLAFIPQPGGRPPTVFRLARLADGEAVFENPEHEFPQQIVYARQGEDRLLAWIEGVRNGVARKIEFAYARVVCVGAAP